MGREIRRVPPHWEHPRWTDDDAYRARDIGKYRHCHDQDYVSATKEWKEEFLLWEKGEHPDQRDCEYWEWNPPPDPDDYRPAFTEKPTWYQVYETVTKGTPVTPPFPIKEALYQHLVTQGDDWSIRRGEPPYSPAAAQAFVYGGGWAPSAVIVDGQVATGAEALTLMKKEKA